MQLKDSDVITNIFCAATIDKVAGKVSEDATYSPEDMCDWQSKHSKLTQAATQNERPKLGKDFLSPE